MKVAIIIDSVEAAIFYLKNSKLLLEFRLDLDIELLELAKKLTKHQLERVILTLRNHDEGGKFNGERESIINQMRKIDAKYIDFEFNNDELLEVNNNRIISYHNYKQPMSKQIELFNPNIGENDILKFVGLPIDTLDYIEANNKMKHYNRKIILGIGKNSEISRTVMKNEFVFGSIDGDKIMKFTDLIKIDDNSTFTGLLGKTLNYSLSPGIHRYLFTKLNYNGYYHILEALDDERARTIIQYLLNTSFKGINVTIPYKQLAYELADTMSKGVELTKATNTLVFKNQKIEAYNTDISGFTQFIKNNNIERYDSATIIGMGGAARACAAALLSIGAEVTLIGKNMNRIDEFTSEMKEQISITTKRKNESEIYINATPSSQLGQDIQKFVNLGDAKIAIDLAYDTNETIFLSNIKKDIQKFDGKEMLFYQALDAFNLWNKINLVLDFHKIESDIF